MRTPVSQRSRRVPPKRHFSPLDSYKSVREIKNLAWEFSPLEMSKLIKVRAKLTCSSVSFSPLSWGGALKLETRAAFPTALFTL